MTRKRSVLPIAAIIVAMTAACGRPGVDAAAEAPTAAPAAAADAARGAPARPLGRGDYQPTIWWPDEMFTRFPYPAGDAPYADLDGFKIKGLVGEITAISRKSRDDGNQYWGRIAGTPYDTMTTNWVEAQFKRVGLEQVRVQQFNLPPQWFPTSWEMSASAAGRTVPMKTAFPLYASVGTSGAVTLEPVWVGMGTDADFDGRDVRGKAVVAYGFPNPGGRSDTAITLGVVKRAQDAGAAALVIVLGFPGNVTNEPAGGASSPPASMPVFLVGNQDGAALRQMIERHESPTLHVRLDVEMKTGLKTATVWGVLPGQTDENVAVMAHTDSFFEGAMDNASGVSTLIALAEHFAHVPKAQRRRTMTFFTTSAHHSPSGENAGLEWIHRNRTDMWEKTALLVNCEHTAQVALFLVGQALYASNQVSARRWYVGGSERLKSIVLDTFRDYGVALYSRPEARPGGELSRVYMDAPSFHIIDHTVYHTDMDTLQAVPAYGLEQSAHAFARIIDQTNAVAMADLRAAPAS
jgi:Peptidase family M28/PA domain